MLKYGVFSGPYFPVFGLNTGKDGPEKTLYLDTFHAVNKEIWNLKLIFMCHVSYGSIIVIIASQQCFEFLSQSERV